MPVEPPAPAQGAGTDAPVPAPPPELPLPTPVVTPPAIVAVSPANGASGVESHTSIVVRFSVGMNRERTEAAYSSESIPPSAARFTWNDASTELTITPDEPLEYAAGTDPANVEARRYAFSLSAAAEDVAGRSLPQPEEFSFSVLRRIEQSLLPVQRRDETGNFRSNDSFGNVTCQRDQTTVCIGDSYVDGQEEQYRGFITFELAALPPELESVERAELDLVVADIVDDPFASLGALMLEHVDFDAIGAEAFASDAIAELGPIAASADVGDPIQVDVASAVAADRVERNVSQFRFRFETTTDVDDTSDIVVLDWSAQRLVVSYLIP